MIEYVIQFLFKFLVIVCAVVINCTLCLWAAPLETPTAAVLSDKVYDWALYIVTVLFTHTWAVTAQKHFNDRTEQCLSNDVNGDMIVLKYWSPRLDAGFIQVNFLRIYSLLFKVFSAPFSVCDIFFLSSDVFSQFVDWMKTIIFRLESSLTRL